MNLAYVMTALAYSLGAALAVGIPVYWLVRAVHPARRGNARRF